MFYFQEGPADDLTLIPLFTPPLRGRLTITRFGGVGLFKDMIQLFGGIRFCYVDLFEVAGTSLGDFDLSQNESLRTLEITAYHLDCALEAGSPNTTPSLLAYALLTITSHAFSEVIVYHRGQDFCGIGFPWQNPPTFQPSPAGAAREDSRHHQRFKALRRVHRIREFELVLCADVWDGVGEYSVEKLKRAVAVEKARGTFDNIFQEPSVIYSPRESRIETQLELQLKQSWTITQAGIHISFLAAVVIVDRRQNVRRMWPQKHDIRLENSKIVRTRRQLSVVPPPGRPLYQIPLLHPLLHSSL
ncbi:hypothetical protein BDM02DRAFT_3264464 [Thelephora ganbajun]|uniref:Uncharacterized protein n=1 Tax=Thelephora ganbajun TaxID=370292 RepID=A0ACB6YZ88_THEGA|nr:hypothetical protein BDM02DRAFT_3264464 [Thelephora ganbajun]